jgi:stage II sporulation protein R
MIGEAKGKNWWCVLFPPLCVGAASGVKEELISVGFTPDQIRVLTDTESPKYRIRFKILDIIGSIFS